MYPWQFGSWEAPRELCIRRAEYVTHIVSMRIFIENPLLTSTKTLVAGVSRASRLATIPSAVERLAGMSQPADSGSLSQINQSEVCYTTHQHGSMRTSWRDMSTIVQAVS
jgi:hypothetical protein